MCLSAVVYYCWVLWTFTNLHFVIVSSFKRSDICCAKKIVYYFPTCDHNIMVKKWKKMRSGQPVIGMVLRLNIYGMSHVLPFSPAIKARSSSAVIRETFIKIIWFFACRLWCKNFWLDQHHTLYLWLFKCQSTEVVLNGAPVVGGRVLWNRVCLTICSAVCQGVFLELDIIRYLWISVWC